MLVKGAPHKPCDNVGYSICIQLSLHDDSKPYYRCTWTLSAPCVLSSHCRLRHRRMSTVCCSSANPFQNMTATSTPWIHTSSTASMFKRYRAVIITNTMWSIYNTILFTFIAICIPYVYHEREICSEAFMSSHGDLYPVFVSRVLYS